MKLLKINFPLFIVTVFFLSGCNVFAGFHTAGSSSDPAILIEDAEIALQQGDAEEAIVILRRALEVDPGNEQATATLSTAILQSNDVTVLDVVNMVDKIRDDVTGGSNATASSIAASLHSAEVCSFSKDQSHEQFLLDDIPGYAVIQGRRDALLEVEALLDGLITAEDLSGTIADLRSAGLIDADIAAAFLNQALVKVILAYQDIEEAGGGDLSFYYVNASAGTYIGYCSPDQATLDRILSVIACHLETLETGIDLIEARAAELLNSEEALELANEGREAFNRLRDEFDAECASPPGSVTALALSPLVSMR